jgi:uncharacterized protein YciI
MLFAFTGKDNAGVLQKRIDARPAHVAFLEKLNAEGTLKIAGPFLDDDGKPFGSLVVIEAADKKTAEAIFAKDPYADAGIFASTEIRQWNWTFNKPQGM